MPRWGIGMIGSRVMGRNPDATGGGNRFPKRQRRGPAWGIAPGRMAEKIGGLKARPHSWSIGKLLTYSPWSYEYIAIPRTGRMRIFLNKPFARFIRKERIATEKLCQAVKNAERGRIDADYGGGVIKQRIARSGEGKSGGYRSVIFYRRGEKAFFVHGFAKNDRANLTENEVLQFKALAREVLALNDEKIVRLLSNGTFAEVHCHDENL